MVSICPPLIITPAEIDELFDRLGRALDRTLDWARRERLVADLRAPQKRTAPDPPPAPFPGPLDAIQ